MIVFYISELEHLYLSSVSLKIIEKQTNSHSINIIVIKK